MPVNLGEDHYLSLSAARKLLVSFNRTIKGTKEAPRTIRGISKMSAMEMENKLKEFQVVKKKSGDVLRHPRVKSLSFSEKIPKSTRRKSSTEGSKSATHSGEDYTGHKGNIKKSAGKDVASENSAKDYEKPAETAAAPTTTKPKKPRSAKQKAATKKLVAMMKKKRAMAAKAKEKIFK